MSDMEQGTPINDIEENDTELVQSILQEMKSKENEQQMQQMQQQQQQQMPQYDDDDDDDIEDYEMENNHMMYEEKQTPLVEKILNELKEPLIVIISFVLFNLPMLDKFASKFIPMAYHNGNISLIGLMMKAVTVGLLFYGVKMLLN